MDFFLISTEDIGLSIQAAIAPIFLLVGTGALLNVVTTRLGRIIDRARSLEELIEAGEDAMLEQRHLLELQTLDQRMKWSNRSVLFSSVSAVLICIVVAFTFILDLMGIPAGMLIAVFFIGMVTSLSAGLICFLVEVSVATRALRVRTEILRRTHKLTDSER